MSGKQDRLDGNVLGYREFANLAFPAGFVSNSWSYPVYNVQKNLALNLLLLAFVA